MCIFSAVEPCATYKPGHDKQTGRTYLKPEDGYVRVPTWLPCRRQIYFNGHNWLAAPLKKRGIDDRLLDNALMEIVDWAQAQCIADGWQAKRIHWKLDELAKRFCPIYRDFGVAYHWSLDPCEYAADIVFRRQADWQVIYGNLTRKAIHTVKPDHIATFLGKKLVPQFQNEMGNRFNVFPALPRGRTSRRRPRNQMGAHADDPGAGMDKTPSRLEERPAKRPLLSRFNFLDEDDPTLCEDLARGEFNISGLQNKTLPPHLAEKSSGQVSRRLKRLRLHGLDKTSI